MDQADKLSVCLTFDFDGMCSWGEVMNQYSPTPMSRGEFAARVAVPRLLKLLAREQVKAAFFIPGHTVDTFPELCGQILDEGHEIGHHGYFHEGPVNLDEAAERQMLEAGLAAMERRLDGYVPVGYRSPAFDLSNNTTKLLIEYGFRYDTSMMAQDFEPYWCRTGDSMPRDRAYEFGPEIELVEVPVSWSLDDFIQLEFVTSPGVFLPGAHNPRDLETRWLDDLDFAAEEVPGGVYTMTFHPEVIGRGARIRVVENMIRRARERGAEITTPAVVAERWAKTAPARQKARVGA
ncbi:MAG: polysaccharide deacetylase [Actinobacteria bacterium]|nr:polysaccharide deacetylase [Actinomycetota bacterium]